MGYRASGIKSVQQRQITLSTTATNFDTLPTPVDPNYSVIMKTASVIAGAYVNSPNAGPLAIAVELSADGTTVTARLFTVTQATVYFTVIEYFPWMMKQAVQHFRAVPGGVTTITAVGAKATLYDGGFTSSGGFQIMSEMMGGSQLTSPTTVTSRGVSTSTVSFCVADFK